MNELVSDREFEIVEIATIVRPKVGPPAPFALSLITVSQPTKPDHAQKITHPLEPREPRLADITVLVDRRDLRIGNETASGKILSVGKVNCPCGARLIATS
ncbi:hypothetical protein MTX20_04110 [Bradyrhizobium sp. ISRA435]|nr:hypothetical protein MTX20_04110 [Bradyrhizobium sp. ISRA435]